MQGIAAKAIKLRMRKSAVPIPATGFAFLHYFLFGEREGTISHSTSLYLTMIFRTCFT